MTDLSTTAACGRRTSETCFRLRRTGQLVELLYVAERSGGQQAFVELTDGTRLLVALDEVTGSELPFAEPFPQAVAA